SRGLSRPRPPSPWPRERKNGERFLSATLDCSPLGSRTRSAVSRCSAAPAAPGPACHGDSVCYIAAVLHRLAGLSLSGLGAAGRLAAQEASPLVERLPDDAPAVATPGYEILENYCVVKEAREAHEAFTVFVARVEGPGRFAETFRFPIARRVYRLRV